MSGGGFTEARAIHIAPHTVQAVVLALVTDANFGGASALSLIGQLEDGNEAVTALSQLGK